MSIINFDQAQLEHLSSLRFMYKLDSHIHLVSSVTVSAANSISERITLQVNIFYDGDPIDDLSFDLKNYTYEEIINIAGNLTKNEFILYEIDNLLSGVIE